MNLKTLQIHPSDAQVKYDFAHKLNRYYALCFTKTNPILNIFHTTSAIKHALPFKSFHLRKNMQSSHDLHHLWWGYFIQFVGSLFFQSNKRNRQILLMRYLPDEVAAKVK